MYNNNGVQYIILFIIPCIYSYGWLPLLDLKTYNSLAGTPQLRRAETQYEYEEAENEKKRRIKILDRRYANQLIKELGSVLD